MTMKMNLLRASCGDFCHLDADEKKWKKEEAEWERGEEDNNLLCMYIVCIGIIGICTPK